MSIVGGQDLSDEVHWVHRQITNNLQGGRKGEVFGSEFSVFYPE